ncbi:MAG: hypothetical protein ACOYXW_12835, partial [Actinomycetota bacterium]
TSDVLDLVCDRQFRTARVQARAGEAWVRGGRTVLDDGAPVLTWLTSSARAAERRALAEVVDTDSPGALVALVRRAAATGRADAGADLSAVRFCAPALGGLSVRLHVVRAGIETHEGLLTERWHVDDMDAGTRTTAYVSGDVVLWAVRGGEDPWEVELADLDSPPSLLARHPRHYSP